MRYATLATLLLLGVFGMSAPVVADAAPVVTVDVTGDSPIYDTQTQFNVTANVGGTSGNYFYNIKVKIEGFTLHNRNYLGNGGTISQVIQCGAWGTFDAGNEIEFIVTIGAVADSLIQDIQ